MQSSSFYCRDVLKSKLSTASDRTLREYENLVTVRMGNIAKFCPWPALEESLAQDIAMIWREQKLRTLARNKGEMK